MPSDREDALAYLQQHHVVTLATQGPDGLWAAAVFYASDGFDLYFLSSPKTRHAVNLAAQPRVAATVQEDYRDWREIKGIQLDGEIRCLDKEERKAAQACYQRKFPFLAGAPAKIATALARVQWYRLRPGSLYYLDNSKGFGHRVQIL